MTLPVAGVYLLQNVQGKTYADLINGGNVTDKNVVQGHSLVITQDFRNQYWYLKPDSDDENLYTIQNIRTAGFLELDGGSQTDGTAVHCTAKSGSDVSDSQIWRITASASVSGAFRIQNYQARSNPVTDNGYLDLKDGSSTNGTKIQGWHKEKKNTQRWNIIARSATAEQIKKLTGATEVIKNASNALPKLFYLQIPNDFFGTLFNSAIGGTTPTIKGRKAGLYDKDARIISFKNYVNEWVRASLSLDSVFYVLVGQAYGSGGTTAHLASTASATLWILNDSLDGLMYLDPESASKLQPDEPSISTKVAFF